MTTRNKKHLTAATLCLWALLLPLAMRAGELPPNLIRNSYMRIVKDGKPEGFTVTGNLTLQAVHPFTHGFEGTYTETRPANAASSIEAAGENAPYWYGGYYKGARIGRGGMADGWYAYTGGNLLKITGSNSEANTMVTFPYEPSIYGSKVRFTAWVKIVKGTEVSFGIDAGYGNTSRGIIVTKATADKSAEGWHRVDQVVGISEVTMLGGYSFCMGLKGSDIEVYLALPYVAIVDEKSWLPSVGDMLANKGLYVEGGRVGIGTSSPEAPLTVRGKIVASEVQVKDFAAIVPDYVFEPGYPLLPLDSVARYVRQHSHLPGVPPAAQMQAEGVNLVELNMLLLQKVEELTLHVIEQQRQIEELKKDRGVKNKIK